MSLGVKLRNLRHARDWSQAEIADRLRISQPAYHLWETDQARPTAENLLRISTVYNLDLYSLLDSNHQNMINNLTFQDNNSAQQQYHSAAYNNIPTELSEKILKNQNQLVQQYEQIFKLIENQKNLIEDLMAKIK